MITSEIAVAYTQCKLKAYLLLSTKKKGISHEYISILEEKAKNSKFRKWEAGLTGWKHWAWQIGGGILFFIIFEYLINLIGLTMIPW